MTEREFIFWLRGYLHYDNVEPLNKNQVNLIKRILRKVDDPDADKKPIDKSILGKEPEYEEVVELYKTYGGD